MKLEVGKTYRTFSGKRARCVCIDANRGTCPPALCLVADASCYEEPRFYHLNGTAEPFAGKEEEIVGEWIEPIVGYMVLEDRRNDIDLPYLAYSTYVYKTIDEALQHSIRSVEGRSVIRVEFTPGVDQLGGE